jgi:two-component system, OmpR family, sensor histidine kinase SenX3
VDATTAALLGGVLGVVVGSAGVLVHRRAPQPAPEQPPADDPAALPEGAVAVLSALPSGSVVVDRGEAVTWASRSAEGLGLLVQGRLADEEVVRAVRATLSSGAVHAFDLSPMRRRRGRPRLLLAVRVVPLTADLVLVLAEDRTAAARVDDVRRDFVANVSHELKTPVGALSLLAEAVEGAADDPEAVVRFAGRMQHESTRLASMVNELIELSRLQGDDVGAQATLVPLDEVVSDGLDFVRTSALAKHIDLRSAGEHGLVVPGVRVQLTTALRNLLDNAINYSGERTRIVVSTQRSGPWVEISVADQGIGISDVDQTRVFERFYRVDPARSRATGGTGLGLSIVKHVCVNHGGEVALWSAEGSGSTFTLRLPAEGPEGADSAGPAEPDARAGAEPIPANPRPNSVGRVIP